MSNQIRGLAVRISFKEFIRITTSDGKSLDIHFADDNEHARTKLVFDGEKKDFIVSRHKYNPEN